MTFAGPAQEGWRAAAVSDTHLAAVTGAGPGNDDEGGRRGSYRLRVWELAAARSFSIDRSNSPSFTSSASIRGSRAIAAAGYSAFALYWLDSGRHVNVETTRSSTTRSSRATRDADPSFRVAFAPDTRRRLCPRSTGARCCGTPPLASANARFAGYATVFSGDARYLAGSAYTPLARRWRSCGICPHSPIPGSSGRTHRSRCLSTAAALPLRGARCQTACGSATFASVIRSVPPLSQVPVRPFHRTGRAWRLPDHRRHGCGSGTLTTLSGIARALPAAPSTAVAPNSGCHAAADTGSSGGTAGRSSSASPSTRTTRLSRCGRRATTAGAGRWRSRAVPRRSADQVDCARRNQCAVIARTTTTVWSSACSTAPENSRTADISRSRMPLAPTAVVPSVSSSDTTRSSPNSSPSADSDSVIPSVMKRNTSPMP